MYVSGKGIGNVSQQRDDTRQFCAIISGLGHKKIQWLRLIEAYDEEGLKDKALKIRHALIKSYSVDIWSSQYLTEN